MGFVYAIIAFIILLPIIVFVHELGHFLFARINGVKVEAFAIGFGPKLFGWRDSYGTDWKICAIPLGGYVKMVGQSDTPESAEKKAEDRKKMSAKEKSQSFEFKKRYQKASIVVAGPLFNFIFGMLVFFGLFFFVGVPDSSIVVHSVIEKSAAQKAGIKENDKILSMNTTKIEKAKDISNIMKKADGSTIEIKVLRDGDVVDLKINPTKENNTYKLGIMYSAIHNNFKKVGFVDAMKASYDDTASIVSETLKGLGQMIIGNRSSKELGGMISIAQISGEALKNGLYSFLYLMSIISISLGLFNLFPIPVLDGGYLFIYIIEGIIRHDLSEKVKEKLFFIGFVFIIFLLLLSNTNDILRFFK
ncbi:MAG: RIP metalloprotease RseP [Alphaproteobacteria bacterium]